MDLKKTAQGIYGTTFHLDVNLIEQALKQVREDALEEAAKLCDKARKWNDAQNCWSTTKSSMMLANEIRELKWKAS